ATPAQTAPAKRAVMIVGHRGAAGAAPENTLAAFQRAIEIGVDAIELDVHLSKDNELIVIHDPTLVRTTDGTGAVRDFTVAELKKLNAAAKFKGSGNYDVQRLPTLQEVFDLVGARAPLQIEIKLAADGSRYPGIEQKVVDHVRRNNAVASAEITSFDFDTVRHVQSLEPRVGRRVPISTAYLRPFGLAGKGPADIAGDLLRQTIPAVDVEKTFLTQPLFDALRPAGLKIGVWTVNDAKEMWKFVEIGVDQITTDRPDLLVPEYRDKR
ncbi:MAG: glycerophosphodiester phosphodiesterase family protein, partial [Chloroflexota bacterium]